jgi:hypothetical protein
MSTKAELQQALKTARPHLSPSSLTTYASVLGSALRSLGLTLADIDANADRLVEYAMAKPSSQTGKSLLSTLVVLTGKDVYKKPMGELMAQQKEQASKQVKSEHRADIDLSFEDVVARAEASDKLIKRNPTNRSLVDNVILHCMTGVDSNPPRRLEWAQVKLRNYDPDTDNYLRGDIVTFNVFKTHKSFGQQTVKIDPKTMKTVRKLVKQSGSDFLLTTVTGRPMSASQLSARIGSIFQNPKVGIDVIRSTYITHVFRGAPGLSAAEELATAMGHSAATAQLHYRKL